MFENEEAEMLKKGVLERRPDGVPKFLLCPLSGDVMSFPVVASDG